MIQMTFEEAKKELASWISRSGELENTNPYVHSFEGGVTLDGEFDPETLIAIGVYLLEYKK
jgi:hypothetical protein